MTCDALRQRIKPLLDDLLSEAEYAECHAHLAACPTCRDHLAQVGSLADSVAALGEVEPPGDLAEAIEFRVRRQADAPPAAPNPSGAPAPGWLPAAGLAGVAVVGLLWYATSRPSRPPAQAADEPVRVQAYVVRPDRRQPSEEVALEQLKAIAERLGVDAPSGHEPVPEAPQGNGSPESPLRWPLRIRPAEQPAVLETLAASGAVIEHHVPGMVLVSVPADGLHRLAERVGAMPGALAEGDRLELGDAAGRAHVRIVIELTGS